MAERTLKITDMTKLLDSGQGLNKSVTNRLYAVVLNADGDVVSHIIWRGGDAYEARRMSVRQADEYIGTDSFIHQARCLAQILSCCGSMVVENVYGADPQQTAILAAVMKRALLQGQLASNQSDDVLKEFQPLHISAPLVLNRNSHHTLRSWASATGTLAPLLEGLRFLHYGHAYESTTYASSLGSYNLQHSLYRWALEQTPLNPPKEST